jgi:hypothetical protein
MFSVELMNRKCDETNKFQKKKVASLKFFGRDKKSLIIKLTKYTFYNFDNIANIGLYIN